MKRPIIFNNRKLILFCFLLNYRIFSFAYDFKVDGIYYNVIGDVVEVTNDALNHIDYSGEIVIPSIVYWGGKSYPISQIGKFAFYMCKNLVSITLNEGIIKIEDYAFHECSGLTNLKFPASLQYIGEDAFSYCVNLKSVNIPENVSSISHDSFIYCSALEKITVSSKNTFYNDGNGCNCVIRNDSNVLVIGTAKTRIPNRVQSIGKHAFLGRVSLTTIEIPDNIKEIDNLAFGYCTALSSIHIPKSVEKISPSAFNGCNNLQNITVDDNNPNYYASNDNNNIIEKNDKSLILCGKNIVISDEVIIIGEYVFSGRDNMQEIIIPNSVKSIKRFSFSGNKSLRKVVIPDSVTEIGMLAFDGDSALTDVWLPGCLKKIEYGIFLECTNLKTINIPPNVTEISWGAFEDCSGIRKVYSYLEDPIPASYYRYSLDFKSCTLYVPKGTKEKYEHVEPWNTFGSIIEMDE